MAPAHPRRRSPSTSPPPMPSIPDPAPMRPTDARWRMVEDELQATAHLFTQHLHFAEYQRLKKAAEARRAAEEAARANSPSSSPSSSSSGQQKAASRRTASHIKKRRRIDAKQEQVARKARQNRASLSPAEEDLRSEESELDIDDRNLASLMSAAGRKKAESKMDLDVLVAGKQLEGRTAEAMHGQRDAGRRARYEDVSSTEDEDDLDALFHVKKRTGKTPASPGTSKARVTNSPQQRRTDIVKDAMPAQGPASFGDIVASMNRVYSGSKMQMKGVANADIETPAREATIEAKPQQNVSSKKRYYATDSEDEILPPPKIESKQQHRPLDRKSSIHSPSPKHTNLKLEEIPFF